MWDLIVSVPDHCLSFYYENIDPRLARGKNHLSTVIYQILQQIIQVVFSV